MARTRVVELSESSAGRPVLLGVIAVVAVATVAAIPTLTLSGQAFLFVVGGLLVFALATLAVLRSAWVVALLAVALPLAPEVDVLRFATGLSERMEYVRVTASPSEAVVAALAVALVAALLGRGRTRLEWHPFLSYALGFVAVAALSIWLARAPLGNNARLCYLYLGRLAEVMAMFAFGLHLGGRRRDMRLILRVVAGAAFILILVAAVLWAAGVNEYIIAMGSRMALGGEVTFLICVLFLVAFSRRGKTRYGLFGLGLVLCGLLVATEKRAVVVGLVAALALLQAFTGVRRAAVVSVVGGALVIAATWSTLESDVERSFSGTAGRYRMSAGLSMIDESQLDSSIVHRFIAWGDAWEAFTESPVVGIGFWGSAYQQRHLPHNQYAQLLAETGLAGFVLFILALRCLVRIGWRARWLLDPEARRFGVAYLAALAGLGAQAFFEQIFLTCQMMGSFFLVGGVLARWIREEARSPEVAGAD